MQMRLLSLVLAVGTILGPLATVAVAADGDKFLGSWKGNIANHDEIWTVKNTGGTWSINGVFKLNGTDAGSFVGADIKVTDTTMTFTRRFVKNPKSGTFLEDLAITVKPEGDNLSYSWSSGGRKGLHAMVKYDETAKPVDPVKPAVGDAGKYIGTWTADVATGFRVVMVISIKNDKPDVSATYYNKKGLVAGGFVGVDTTYKDGNITFTQKFTPKPVSSWNDGKFHTLELNGDNALKFSWKNGGTENFTRSKK